MTNTATRPRPALDDRLARTLETIDRTNEADPNRVTVNGVSVPLALAEGRVASDWVRRLRGDEAAPAALLIAARGHHIRRWETPRDSYPRDRAGYQAWRLRLYQVHAQHLADVMRGEGYREDEIGQVGRLVHKRDIKTDADAQTFEDAVALAFLEVPFAPFAARTARPTIIRALRRTWRKMSDQGRAAALTLVLPPELQTIVDEALVTPAGPESPEEAR